MLRYFSPFVLVLMAAQASADPIPGLFNTGVNNSNALLADQAVDPHYLLVFGPPPVAGSLPNTFAYDEATSIQTKLYSVYNNSWVKDTAVSQWIGPAPDIMTPHSPAWDTPPPYIYDLNFNLMGLDSASASISGTWATDNGSQIFLNNVATGFVKGPSGFGTLDPFLITSGFLPGPNTLEFRVSNDPAGDGVFNPTGLHVSDLAGTANVLVPEPSTIVLLSMGAIGLMGTSLRRLRRRAA